MSTATPAALSGRDDDVRRLSGRSVLSLHGADPVNGIPATWHVTCLEEDGADGYLVERAEGDIHSPALWMQAQRDAAVVGEDAVIALVRSVLRAEA